MVGLRCADGSFLSVTPVLCNDSAGMPYEVTLELSRDGVPYGTVGERCAWRLARLARGVEAARRDHGQAGRWPDPDDRFPPEEGGAELFSFRYRSRWGGVAGGELRCQLRTIPLWTPRPEQRGEWRLTRRAFVEAWGVGGLGTRAILTSGELAGFVRALVDEAEGCLGNTDPGKVRVQGTGTGETR
ncbi:hypothetical protein [Nonomuraea harbinensis]|uniref:Polyketide cyclase / dehydrase and lipid transport n=1 Tax=Nonomuraea harbinensis TaxID=1286938 RepID=A0ABW1BWK0_9ACTN|nr:hypothetical protein [Nonomuraea harbinensis]